MNAPKHGHKEDEVADLSVLVTYSSVHGSTAEIARAIALTLGRAGIDAEVMPVAQVQDVRGFDSVVVGSAVFGGQWTNEAAGFLERFALDLFHTDVWLFQSGPLGHSAQAIVRALPLNVSLFAEYLRVKGMATFGGRLNSLSGGAVARFLTRAGYDGDYRDFNEIRLWAEEIARRTAMMVVTERGEPFALAKAATRR
jgi:menaquinone-dependent protoporphyrinogen oxidase